MELITLYGKHTLEACRFIPKQQTKFMYIQAGKKPNTLTLITSIPELANISTCEGLFKTDSETINFLLADTCEPLKLTKITNIDKLLLNGFTTKEGIHLNNLKNVKFTKPIIYLEEYLDGYRLTYSKALIPHTDAFNFIAIGK